MTIPPDEPAPEAPATRTALTWIALLVVWFLGAISWMVYIGLGWTLLYHIF